jgi:hypothetical protein
MALELCVLDDLGQPIRGVAIRIDDHDELVEACSHLPMLGRLADYNEDATYDPREVAELRAELDEVASELPEDLEPLIARLRGLCDAALSQRLGIEAIAG